MRIHRRWLATRLFLCVLLAMLTGCSADSESETEGEPTVTPAPTAVTSLIEPGRSNSSYQRLPVPVAVRSETPSASVQQIGEGAFTAASGEFQISIGGEQNPATAIVISHGDASTALALRPLGAGWNLLEHVSTIEPWEVDGRVGARLAGNAPWARFEMIIELFPQSAGLLHYRVDVQPQGELPPGGSGLEWQFVDPLSGDEAAANLEIYADRAANGAPAFYGYSDTLDATLLYWLDLTELNPFMETTRYSPASTVTRQGRTFGHNLSPVELRRLPAGEPVTLYDGYLYLSPGRPADERAMYLAYLQQVGDIYDLIAKPPVELPDWQALARETLADLDDPDTWVELEGRRYWRAYVADTRESAEAITQLDVGLAAARHAARYQDEQSQTIAALAEAVLEDFYNPRFGLVQNSGPISVTGDQGRGDTWYELGHVVKLAEWGLLGSEVAADLAMRSASAWMDYGHAVDYRFHQFYNFPNPDSPETAWQGSQREPDAAGGYAYYMLLLHELSGDTLYLDEAIASVEALQGNGFNLAYETHITAQAAASLAWLWQHTGDARYLELSYGPIANLVRLAWIWEEDSGIAGSATTFWGLNPTQRSNVITPKEQYEVWIYLDDYLRRAHGQIDPTVEKLVAEFLKYTLDTLSYSLPPVAPEGLVTESPAAYPTVSQNRLDLYIPVEDVRGSSGIWGAIGQQVYGAGLAPTFAALAYREIEPGVTLYSGYPAVSSDGDTYSLAAPEGYSTPIQLWGASLAGDDGESCGEALCFEAVGGDALQFQAR